MGRVWPSVEYSGQGWIYQLYKELRKLRSEPHGYLGRIIPGRENSKHKAWRWESVCPFLCVKRKPLATLSRTDYRAARVEEETSSLT